MARNVSRRRWLGISVTVLVLGGLAVVAIWQSLAQSTNPDYQVRRESPGMNEYYVNLWTDPHPPTTGEVELSAQLTTIIGSEIGVNTLAFDITPPGGGEPTTLETAYTNDGPNDGGIHVAEATFDQPGTWQVAVRYNPGGPELVDEFDIEVSE